MAKDTDDIITVRLRPWGVVLTVPFVVAAICLLTLLPWILANPGPEAGLAVREGWAIGLVALVVYPVYLACLVLTLLAVKRRRPALSVLWRDVSLLGGVLVFLGVMAVSLWLLLAPSSGTP